MKNIKVVIYIGLIIAIISLIFYKNEKIDEVWKKDTIMKINIIDKEDNMKKLYEQPEKEEYVTVDVIINDKYYKDVGIRTKGSGIYTLLRKTKNQNKHSYKLKLDYVNKRQKYAGITEIHLNTGAPDKSGIREYMVYEIYNKMGIETQKYAFGNLQINGINEGLVTVVEVINEEYVRKAYKNQQGNLYKPKIIGSKIKAELNLKYINDKIGSYKMIFSDTKTKNTKEDDKKRLISIIKNINEEIEDGDLENNFIDFEKIIKMMAINKVVGNLDNFAGGNAKNYYLYEEGGKIDFIPYDFNVSLGLNTNIIIWNDEDFNLAKISKSNRDNFITVEIIEKNEKYKIKYYEYIEETIEMLERMNIIGQIEKLKNRVDTIKENERNEIYTYDEYVKETEEIVNFLEKRLSKEREEKLPKNP